MHAVSAVSAQYLWLEANMHVTTFKVAHNMHACISSRFGAHNTALSANLHGPL